jgi:predicted RNA-binding Zn-ribbon protein involved in translation (DUF1610 family)
MKLSHKEILACLIAEYGSLDLAMAEGYTEGICHNCGYIQDNVEPGVVGYKCENCDDEEIYEDEETKPKLKDA